MMGEKQVGRDGHGDVPVTGHDQQTVDMFAGGAYGVVGGVPRGETVRDRDREARRRNKFQPGFAARAAAATRRALGW